MAAIVKLLTTGLNCIYLSLPLSRYHLKEFVECRTKWLRLLLTWIYVSLYAIAGVAFWRGIWSLMTRDIGEPCFTYKFVQKVWVQVINPIPVNPLADQSKPSYAHRQTCRQCGLFCLLGRDQKIEMKLGCENIMSQHTIVQLIELKERLTIKAPITIFPFFGRFFAFNRRKYSYFQIS